MRAEVVSDVEGLRSLTREWDGLVQGAVGDSLFVDPAFVVPWWEVYGLGGGLPAAARLHTVCVRDNDGVIAGIAPMYATDATLRWLGSGGDTSPDYLGVVARPGAEVAVATALGAHLASRAAPPWDALLLTDLADDALMTHALAAALGRAPGVVVGRTADATCPQLSLAHSVAAHRAGLTGRLRRVFTDDRRRLEKKGARFCRWTDEGTTAAGLAELARLHGQRFAAQGVPHSFASSHYCAFHERIAAAFHQRGELRLYVLAVGTQTVAMLYGFRRGPVLYYFQGGFDPAWARASVGHVLLSCVLEDAIGEGVRRVDFLKGEHAYKDEWATSRRRTIRLTVVRPSRRGLGHFYRSVGRPWAGALWHRLRSPKRFLGEAFQRLEVRTVIRRGGLRGVAKYGLGAALCHSGLMRAALGLLRRVDPERRLVVLVYHKVLPLPWPAGIRGDCVTSDHFESQARILAGLFGHPTPPAALAALGMAPDRRAPYPMLVTIDDGYDSTRRIAWPVLRRHGLPLMFFVSASAGSDDFVWTDEVRELVRAAPGPELLLRLPDHEERYPLGTPTARLDLADALKRRLKQLDHQSFSELLGALRAARTSGCLSHHDGTRLLEWDDAREMQRAGVALGSHTQQHLILARLPDELLHDEIDGGQRALQAQLGAAPPYFAYPNGYAEDIDPSAVSAVAAAGCTHAFTMISGVAGGSDHPLLLPRIAPEDAPGVMLGLELLHLLAREVLRSRARRPWGRSYGSH